MISEYDDRYDNFRVDFARRIGIEDASSDIGSAYTSYKDGEFELVTGYWRGTWGGGIVGTSAERKKKLQVYITTDVIWYSIEMSQAMFGRTLSFLPHFF